MGPKYDLHLPSVGFFTRGLKSVYMPWVPTLCLAQFTEDPKARVQGSGSGESDVTGSKF